LGNKIIHPYSDFLLHNVAPVTASSKTGGQETAQKMRTPPLWGRPHTHGVAARRPLFHFYEHQSSAIVASSTGNEQFQQTSAQTQQNSSLLSCAPFSGAARAGAAVFAIRRPIFSPVGLHFFTFHQGT